MATLKLKNTIPSSTPSNSDLIGNSKIRLKKNPNYREIPFGGNDGDVLKKVGDSTSDQYVWSTPEGGSGSNDYNELDNKPSINGAVLVGDRSLSEFGIYTITADDILRIWEEEI